MGTITIKNLIGGSINIITTGGGNTPPAGNEKTRIWFASDAEDYTEYDWSGEISLQTMTDAGLFDIDEDEWNRYPVKVEIGTNVTRIANAFWECMELISITIPESVTSIGDRAFFNTTLESITIPSSVTSIGYYAFRQCNFLTSASILGFTEAQIRENADSWGLVNEGMTITASDGTFTL